MVVLAAGLVTIKFRSLRAVLYRNAKEMVIAPFQMVGELNISVMPSLKVTGHTFLMCNTM